MREYFRIICGIAGSLLSIQGRITGDMLNPLRRMNTWSVGASTLDIVGKCA